MHVTKNGTALLLVWKGISNNIEIWRMSAKKWRKISHLPETNPMKPWMRRFLIEKPVFLEKYEKQQAELASSDQTQWWIARLPDTQFQMNQYLLWLGLQSYSGQKCRNNSQNVNAKFRSWSNRLLMQYAFANLSSWSVCLHLLQNQSWYGACGNMS